MIVDRADSSGGEAQSAYDRVLAIRDDYLDRTVTLWRGQERRKANVPGLIKKSPHRASSLQRHRDAADCQELRRRVGFAVATAATEKAGRLRYSVSSAGRWSQGHWHVTAVRAEESGSDDSSNRNK